MLHAFGALGVPLVGDDEPSGLAVRRHQQLHARLDVVVVEALVRDVEEVIAAGLVEVEPHVDLVEECLVGLRGLQIRLAVGADQKFGQSLRVVGREFQLRDDLRQDLVDGLEGDFRGGDIFGQLVDVVERVEYRPERPANRDVETVAFPIEVGL